MDLQKPNPYLKLDDPGVIRERILMAVKNFSSKSHLSGAINGPEKRSSTVTGFNGEGSKFWACVQLFDQAVIKQKGEAELLLCFRTDSDITGTGGVVSKVSIQSGDSCVLPAGDERFFPANHWISIRPLVISVCSITTATGQTLATSTKTCAEFVKHDGKYTRGKNVTPGDETYACRILEDAAFALRKDIEERGWLADGDLHVVFDILFKVLEGGHPKTIIASDPLLTALRNQLDCPIIPDFTLISSDGEEIKSHKLILALQSPVFRAMFENGLKETKSGICQIEDADAKSIKAMLAYLVGVEPKEWNFDLAKGLFELADKYQLPTLLKRSGMELAKRITMGNLPDFLRSAYQHSATTLLNEAFHFLEDNFLEATLDGVLVRLASKDMPEGLFREWQAHWFKRRHGLEMKELEKPKHNAGG